MPYGIDTEEEFLRQLELARENFADMRKRASLRDSIDMPPPEMAGYAGFHNGLHTLHRDYGPVVQAIYLAFKHPFKGSGRLPDGQLAVLNKAAWEHFKTS
jgi:hypothetical protein